MKFKSILETVNDLSSLEGSELHRTNLGLGPPFSDLEKEEIVDNNIKKSHEIIINTNEPILSTKEARDLRKRFIKDMDSVNRYHLSRGWNVGYKAGYKDGYEVGFSEGYEVCRLDIIEQQIMEEESK